MADVMISMEAKITAINDVIISIFSFISIF